MAASINPHPNSADSLPAEQDKPRHRRVLQRFSSAAWRRLSCVWSWFTADRPSQAVPLALQWLTHLGREEWLPEFAGSQQPSPGATAGSIPTVLAFGYRKEAQRWANWLCAIQQIDGAIPDATLKTASLFNTARAIEAWLVLVQEEPELEIAIHRACEYIHSRIAKDGQILIPEDSNSIDRWGPSILHLNCLPPLVEAGKRWGIGPWQRDAHLALNHWMQTTDDKYHAVPTHLLAWGIEALLQLDRYFPEFDDFCTPKEHSASPTSETFTNRPLHDNTGINRLFELLGTRQRSDGFLPAMLSSSWVSSRGLAHTATLWYRCGQRQRGDRALHCLERHQKATGGFPGSWGPRASYHRRHELTWTAKHYLDAALLRVETAFEVLQEDFPDHIDPTDGRMQAVFHWAKSLGDEAAIADVGCGKGRFLRHLAHRHPKCSLTGVDISAAMLRKLPEGVEAISGNLLNLSIADGTFDGAFAVESIEHALLPEQAIAELCRIVRSGGQVLIIDKDRRKQALSIHDPWEQWFSPEQLAAWLARHCEDVQVTHISHAEGLGGSDLFLAATGRRR